MLWEELTGRREAEDISLQPQVQAGHAFEDVARLELERKYGKTFKPSFVKGKNEWMGGNLDGLSEDGKELIEIKIAGVEKQKAAREGVVFDEHKAQCQWYLALTGADVCHYAIYVPKTEELITVDLFPDAQYQSYIMKAAYDFWRNNVCADVAPPYSKGDCIELKEPEFLAAAEQYRNLTSQRKLLEIQIKALEELIESRLAPYPSIKGGGIRATKVERMGSIDYSKIEVLKDVDLNSYRKKASTYMKISIGESDVV